MIDDKEVKKAKENPNNNESPNINNNKESPDINNNKENLNIKPKFCPKCGAKTKPNYKFCKSCGHQLLAFEQVGNETKNDNKNFQIANEPKTEDLPKSFKIPNSLEKKDKSKKAMENIIEFTKEKNSNIDIVEDFEKVNKESSNIDIVEDFEKVNKESSNIDIVEDFEKVNKKDVNSYLVADEILKFHELKKKGIITSEEFEKKKKQLLDL